MAKYTTLTELFTGIADALRRKTGGTAAIVADDFPSVIDSLSIGGSNGDSNNFHIIPLTLAATGGTATVMPTILSGNAFVKENYAKEGFFAMLIPLNAADSLHASKTVTFIYAGNRAIINAKATGYGLYSLSNGETEYAGGKIHTAKISENGYNVTLRANSSGNIVLYVTANYTVPAGNYMLFLGLVE